MSLCSPTRRVVPTWLLVFAGLALFWQASAQMPVVPGPGAGDRPVVLMLHGRGVVDADSTYLREEWLDALNQGLVGVTKQAPLTPGDFRLIWYSDALDPRTPSACREGRGTAPQGDVGGLLATVGGLMGVVADVMGDVEAEALRSLAGDLLYLGDDRKRCAAEERLAEALARAAAEGRPVVLIAHSFGSLVAHHHLTLRDTANAPPVERLVTIGSLVGRPEMRELLLGSRGRRVELPARVGSWVNVRDPNDDLSASISGERPDSLDARIVDRRTERPPLADPHDATRYLLDPATARAVWEAWCSAFPAGRTEAQGCNP